MSETMLVTGRSQETMTDYVAIVQTNNKQEIRRCGSILCGLSVRDIFIFFIHLLLPLSLGIFTVIITLHQQQLARKLRLEDQEIASVQRLQDLNSSASQRLQEKLIAQQEREEDEFRRYQDLNISVLRRQLDLHIAETKRLTDNSNSEKQRNMSREQREHELKIEQQRYDQERTKYIDNLLLTYINDIGILLDKSHGLLTNNPTIAALARAKTVNIIKQIGVKRSIEILQFLHDSGQLITDQNPLDLIGAQLNGLSLRKHDHFLTMHNISLRNTYLDNAAFDNQDLSDWDFSGARLRKATFHGANCTRTKFDQADLMEADFSFAFLTNTSFRGANITGGTLFQISGITQVYYANFERANFSHTSFEMSSSHQRIEFIDCYFHRTVFHASRFRYVAFLFSNLAHADFSHAYLQHVSFRQSTLVGASFANAQHMEFIQVTHANFSFANLSGVSYYPDLDANVAKALSFYNAILPNGTLAPARASTYLLQDTHANCTKENSPISLTGTNWRVKSGQIIRHFDNIKRHQCLFRTNAHFNNADGKMSQKLDVSNRPESQNGYANLILDGRALLTIRSSSSFFAEIYVDQLRNHQLPMIKHTHTTPKFSWDEEKILEMMLSSTSNGDQNYDKETFVQSHILLDKDTLQLDVSVILLGKKYGPDIWCEYVEFEINPDIYSPRD
jgi:uncharacterized protein YjbI with pentapeptide repeats